MATSNQQTLWVFNLNAKLDLNFKKKIREKLLLIANKSLEEAKQSLDAQKEYATSDELKSEGKYDTRAIEAKYLLDAQRKRAHELEEEIRLLQELEFHENTREIALGSLIQLEHNGTKNWHFLSTAQGGKILQVDELTILIISVFSPLGSELMGQLEGEGFELETPKGIRSYEILRIV